MIVEERTYTLAPGQVPTYYDFYRERALDLQKESLGHLVGYYHTEIGALNQVVHLWAYADHAERERRRAALYAKPEWQAFLRDLPVEVRKMENRILIPAPFAPVK